MFTVKKIFIILILFFAAVYFLLTHYFSDLQINKYPDLQTVQKEKAIAHGWVPALLPDSAYDIMETHNIDDNTLFGSFRYKEKDERELMQKLRLLPESNETYVWGDFLFKVIHEKHRVKYRNRPISVR